MPSPYPSARVAVESDTWEAFRLLALRRGISISTYLGRLVAAETKRRHAPGVETIDPDAPLQVQSLETLAAVRLNIDELTDIAGRLARMAIDAGSSWERVAKAVRVSPSDARHAFEQPRGATVRTVAPGCQSVSGTAVDAERSEVSEVKWWLTLRDGDAW